MCLEFAGDYLPVTATSPPSTLLMRSPIISFLVVMRLKQQPNRPPPSEALMVVTADLAAYFHL